MLNTASPQVNRSCRLQYLLPIFIFAFLDPTVALISKENRPMKKGHSIFLQPPVPLENGEQQPPKPYFNPKTYTVADYHDLVNGFAEEMKQTFFRFEAKTANMASTMEELVKKVAKFEAKETSTDSLLPMLNESTFLFALFGVLWIVLTVAVMFLGFCFWQHRENSKYSSTEKLFSSH